MQCNLKWDKPISIIILAVLSNAIWLAEILSHGWEGLIWLEYKHVAFYIIFGLFLCWLIFINRKNGIKKILFKIAVYGVVYLLFMLIFMDTVYALFNPFLSFLSLLIFKFYGTSFFSTPFFNLHFQYFYYGTVILIQILIILLFNILIAKIEKQKINILLILGGIIIIPVMTIMAAFLITNIPALKIYTLHLDPIHWLKTGSIIFGFIIYECSYIAYLTK